MDRLEVGTPRLHARSTLRLAAYAALLIVVSTIWSYYRLSAGTLIGDENSFACTTERMRATGDWVVPRITEEPHLNATPLYNWLTWAVAPWFDESPLWHRFWTALFGVGCVLATFGLGAALYGAEVGLLAGLLLIFNRDFLFMHGIRACGMESLLTFFVTAGILFFVRIRARLATSWADWAGLGLCFGLACISKPPVFGVLFFGTLVLFHLATRHESFASRLSGPSFAAAVTVAVAMPWYVALWLQLGNPALHELFVFNSVQRALDPTARIPFWWHDAILHSSNAFKLFDLALFGALLCCFCNHRRSNTSLLLTPMVIFLAAMTVAGKPAQYAYYVFPLIAILLAAFFLDFGPDLARRFLPVASARYALLGCASIGLLLASADGLKTLRTFGEPEWIHPPFGAYKHFDDKKVRIVLFDFPDQVGAFSARKDGFHAEDFYYTPRMPKALRVNDVPTLKSLLADKQPTALFLPPLAARQPDLAGLVPDVRVQETLKYYSTYPILGFHGAIAESELERVRFIARGGQR
jgi:4-amino-4-deoxy-L-arabinose transferase-like glycosyltransferase